MARVQNVFGLVGAVAIVFGKPVAHALEREVVEVRAQLHGVAMHHRDGVDDAFEVNGIGAHQPILNGEGVTCRIHVPMK